MFPNEVSLTKVGSWKWLQEEMMMVNISVEQNILTLLIRRFCTAFFFFKYSSVCLSAWGNCYAQGARCFSSSYEIM